MELIAVDLGALVSVGGEGVTNLALLGDLCGSADELVVDLLVNEEATAGNAALSLVEVETHLRLGDGEVDIGVVHDNVS